MCNFSNDKWIGKAGLNMTWGCKAIQFICLVSIFICSLYMCTKFYLVQVKYQIILQSTLVYLSPATSHKSRNRCIRSWSLSLLLLDWEDPHPVVYYLRSKILLDPHDLIVLGGPLPPTRSSRIDLDHTKSNGNIRTLHLPQSVKGHDTPSALLKQLPGIDNLGCVIDMIHLEE